MTQQWQAAGFVVVDVRPASLNPADCKHIAPGQDPALLPLGFEVAGVIRADGPGTEIASGGGAPGAKVIAASGLILAGAVGTSVLPQARLTGARVIGPGTA